MNVDVAARVIDRTRALAAIPAPTLDEGDRADVVAGWWSLELQDVSIDTVGNVWAQVRAGTGPAAIVAAHLDTVFSREVDHRTREVDGRLYGPSVGDDSVAVAALSTLNQLLPDDPGGPVWIVATVGEEGLGNLRGIRHALAEPRMDIGAVIAVEGNWLGRVCLTGVGSIRRRIELRGPGGHAWEASAAPSAVHRICRIVAALDQAHRPEAGRTSMNVGLIGGGTAINARADRAWFDVDLRSVTADGLAALVDTLETCIDEHCGDMVVISESLGDRPAGRLDPAHPLARAAMTALGAHGLEARITAASTDANAAHAAGIPAIAIGVTCGEQEHTTNEWIELEPIATGLRVLADTVTGYLRRTR